MSPYRLSMFLTLVCLLLGGRVLLADDLRLNQIQVIGTHNSYHIAPVPAMLQLISAASPDVAPTLDYTHRPLEEQFGELGLRTIEIDVFADPEGGRYANPLGYAMLKPQGDAAGPHPDPDGELKQAGFKVLHVPDIDYLTTVRTFDQALKRIQVWSDAHPTHVPIFILLELKDEKVTGLTAPVIFTPSMLDDIDNAIRAIFPPEKLITPDQVRGNHQTLREAVVQTGWPTLDAARGRVLFALDNPGQLRDMYVADHPSLRGRVLFVSPEQEAAPEAAFFKLNDPVGQFDQIQRLVSEGFLIRTRADSNTQQSRENDPTHRDKAFASGAQIISTDYPQADERFSEYAVRFPNNRAVRANIVNTDGAVSVMDIGTSE